MRKLIVLMLLVLVPKFAVAETEYDYKNPEHKADNDCVGVLGLVRDALYGDTDFNIDTSTLKQRVSPDSSSSDFLREIGSMSDSFILKYSYSRQFNRHYGAHKILIKARVSERGIGYLTDEVVKCVDRL